MEGKNCPQCGRVSDWLSTTNEWEYYCPACDVRFNKHDEVMLAMDRRGTMEKPGNIENDRRKKTETGSDTLKYFLRDIADVEVITADGPIPLTDIFPNGVVFEMRGDEITSIRHPECGDDPEMMARIEQGLKRMNALLLADKQHD